MSPYTLRYFDIPVRGETAKVLLLLSGADWKLETPAWPQDKDAQPVGKLPVLIENSAEGSDAEPFVLTETGAIEYYLAAKNGYVYQPDNITLVARQLELRSHIADLCSAFVDWKLCSNDQQPKLKESYKSTAGYLVRLHEKILKENGSNSHYFGSKTTLVDVVLFANIIALRTEFAGLDPEMSQLLSEENAPEINKVINAVSAEPALAAYVAETK
ncbi:hypothetical protein IW140_004497 [Coemansia sp. RSA 1813]|nr:hypothetical protein EV178_004688 [Coemansia sp. RSA 1646]KAJ1771159.1 hypothetical protein LPJ74_002548 [Coemansia sp. RSA 1843]KAJ2087817.1 hypothetical protein IW138_004712 [Coemansia sp. RSA 986]KAJ2212710.1 hypothetical protein EV179_004458 [Coemansia sp. RSA 487]KAJ2567364.1 hypothetical protein IW140_004497 [Coemansia sp. RSA 1813]